ncbi:MAG: YkgJ family cysteine cluster protein [Thermodesulfobacteriota bacterium]|nr:YkgJ family cysteine cluster protein [Thermodesulfobacteriota bacterium]
MEDYDVYERSLNDTFTFSCDPGVSCFNECCGDLSQYLTPYDILRLKNHLGMPSSEFLAVYTTQHIGGESGLVVVSLKPDPSSKALRCPFVSPEGCRVYEDRPASCRSYPLARVASRSRETGKITERYMLMKEPHCKGFGRERTITVRQWVEEQGLAPYNRANDLMMELISAKNRFAPGQQLDLTSQNIFYTGCYDLDRFRTEILGTGELADMGFDEKRCAAAKTDDDILLPLALEWVKRMLYGTTY